MNNNIRHRQHKYKGWNIEPTYTDEWELTPIEIEKDIKIWEKFKNEQEPIIFPTLKECKGFVNAEEGRALLLYLKNYYLV